MRDMDYVITTRELAIWAREEAIDFAGLADSSYDRLMGEASGARVIFGNTGGVMEAAICGLHMKLSQNRKLRPYFYDLEPVRGMEDVKEAEVVIEGLKVNIAVIYGTKAASKFIERIKEGGKEYHFIEVG